MIGVISGLAYVNIFGIHTGWNTYLLFCLHHRRIAYIALNAVPVLQNSMVLVFNFCVDEK